ncbi:type II toxin-antitoxin system prevent-host-death family antitoxin [Microbacterium kunmingense]|uniref:type II toxin-antitoxin system prevent-host-death family antitoxin n=1 Tax=Microbacterium kunmingense TaxID=2915939 RepID=UPI0020035AFE|nr:type II toxin-antitoxin system prevent-host-death family antitoxin [Microbacterium kunmingense]
MREVGIRALKQNASAVVAAAAAGDVVVITDRGRPVAQLSALPSTGLSRLLESGRARPARRRLADLPPAVAAPSLSEELAAMRDAERF